MENVVSNLLQNILKIVDSWWKTLPKDENLVGLKPQEMNKPMIPFLQMVNGRTNKVGCAYHICGQDYYDQYVQPFILFVCKYGHPLIKIGDPIYTVGPPCDSCKNRCLHGALCDTMFGRY
ncbi:hypothetical protein DICVIV_10149 [Dictyocaulus viviparus]|uniref:SCP domain-containing protein n=1 Tax=Dictyocaulus viviparus TaxID=29172 RepID=A0A0D8XJ59_DICVI|nr:hypothetical protein DICVIV_10149 [Dictyocaulus viviparus]